MYTSRLVKLSLFAILCVGIAHAQTVATPTIVTTVSKDATPTVPATTNTTVVADTKKTPAASTTTDQKSTPAVATTAPVPNEQKTTPVVTTNTPVTATNTPTVATNTPVVTTDHKRIIVTPTTDVKKTVTTAAVDTKKATVAVATNETKAAETKTDATPKPTNNIKIAVQNDTRKVYSPEYLQYCERLFGGSHRSQQHLCASDGHVYVNLSVAICMRRDNKKIRICSKKKTLDFCRQECSRSFAMNN